MDGTSREIDLLIRQLLSPHAKYHNNDGAVFDVYKVKGARDRFWHDPLLRELLLKTRDSYRRYGTRIPIDQFDAKAAIYLVRTKYPSEDGTAYIEEWFSSRMVPGSGSPLGVGEPEIYFYKGHSLDYWLQKKLGCSKASFWAKVLSSSRMCSTPPYISGAGEMKEAGSRLKRKYTAVCYAITCAQFLLDANFQTGDIVTAIIPDDLVEKSLCVSGGAGKTAVPLFTKAHEFLGILETAVKLDRSIYAYEFPLYWLDIGQLVSLLERLQSDGKISEEGLEYYLCGNLPFNFNTANLGALLTVAGKIHGSNITGEELRALVDTHVSERPSPRITSAYEWFASILHVLKVAGVDIFTQHSKLNSFLPQRSPQEVKT